MAGYKSYSRRYKEENNLFHNGDIYEYDKLPDKLRITLSYVILGHSQIYHVIQEFGEKIVKYLCKEHSLQYGLSNQPSLDDISAGMQIKNAIQYTDDTLLYLDLLELLVRLVPKDQDCTTILDMIQEINQYMLEHGFGYQIESGQIIRIDNQFIHKEIIKPAIQLSTLEEFEIVNKEFFEAFEHYKKGHYQESITNAVKAFESTMKIILSKMDIEANNENASRLIENLSAEGIIQSYMREPLLQLTRIRNKDAAHGTGNKTPLSKPKIKILAQTAINLCASNITYCIENYKLHIKSQ